MSNRGVPKISSWAITTLRVICKGIMDIIHHNKGISFKEVDLEMEMVREVLRTLS